MDAKVLEVRDDHRLAITLGTTEARGVRRVGRSGVFGTRRRPDGPRRPVSGREALILALSAFLTLRLATPPTRWEVAVLLPCALGLAAAGAWTGRQARRRSRLRGERSPGALPALVVGGFTLVMAALAGFGFAFMPEMRAYNECLLGANTHTAISACRDVLPEPQLRRLESP